MDTIATFVAAHPWWTTLWLGLICAAVVEIVCRWHEGPNGGMKP